MKPVYVLRLALLLLNFQFFSNRCYAKERLNLTAAIHQTLAGGFYKDPMGCTFPNVMAHMRLNESRFFILDSPGRKDVELNWTDSKLFCEALGPQWRLARVEHLTTFRFLGKALEMLITPFQVGPDDVEGVPATGTSWKDTWYWVDAKYDYDQHLYVDSDGQVLKFNMVMLYRSHRPVGIGAHVHWYDREYNHLSAVKGRHIPQCLTFALPWPNRVEQKSRGKKYGHQASFDERPCEAKQIFKPMCETTQPECRVNEAVRDYDYFSTEFQEKSTGYKLLDYVEDGLFIFANRRFIMNMFPRNQEEAKSYCEDLGEKLYSPRIGDDCLLPYIKFWNRELTHLHFWTSVRASYDGNTNNTQMVYEDDGTPFELWNRGVMKNTSFTVERSDFTMSIGPSLQKRSKEIKPLYGDLCVTANWGFEYPDDTACHNCSWAWITYALARCELYMGTICSPKDYNPAIHTCDFDADWMNKDGQYGVAVNSTSVVEFGFKGSGFWRSTYKQQFGERQCKRPEMEDDFEMTYSNVSYWELPPDTSVDHHYDFIETYWVIDANSTLDINEQYEEYEEVDTFSCLVSKARPINGDRANGYERESLKRVNCKEFHFYICGPDKFEDE